MKTSTYNERTKSMSATATQTETAFAASMRAVIIFDNFDFAAKANAMLAGVAYSADEGAQWDVRPWHAGKLEQSGPAVEALIEAASAHLILLAFRQQKPLPSTMLNWLETWAASRLVPDAALAVWDGGDVGALSRPVASELCQFAERHGLSFIFDSGDSVGRDATTFVIDLHEREVAVTPTLLSIRDVVERGYSHWGINE
jgi:hypothetical protein